MSGLLIRHKCDNRKCCNPGHLESGTHKENMSDKSLRGRAKGLKGILNNKAKLNEDDVRNIRTLIDEGASDMKISKMFPVSDSAINMIRSGRNWSWLV